MRIDYKLVISTGIPTSLRRDEVEKSSLCNNLFISNDKLLERIRHSRNLSAGIHFSPDGCFHSNDKLLAKNGSKCN